MLTSCRYLTNDGIPDFANPKAGIGHAYVTRKIGTSLTEDLGTRNFETPLRLQVGADAVSSVRSHSEALLREWAKWEAVGKATGFGD